LGKRVLDIVDSLRLRIIRLTRHRPREINIDVFANPEKYLLRLPLEKIVADTKVDPEAIEMYKKKIENGEKIAPLIVVKHPKFDLYAVLDGHHRYYALLELGKKKVDCALAGDFSSLMFYMTEHGYFQPKPQTKEEDQKKIIHLHENVQDFLQNFLKDPNKLQKPKEKTKQVED